MTDDSNRMSTADRLFEFTRALRKLNDVAAAIEVALENPNVEQTVTVKPPMAKHVNRLILEDLLSMRRKGMDFRLTTGKVIGLHVSLTWRDDAASPVRYWKRNIEREAKV